MTKKYLVGLFVLVSLIVYGVFWAMQLKKADDEQKLYASMDYYSGTFTIDDYSFFEDDTGVVVHWKSEKPEEDALALKYNKFLKGELKVTLGSKNENYIIRENMKLPSHPEDVEEYDKDNYYTLSIYKIQNKKLKGYKVDLYKLVSSYKSQYLPRGISQEVIIIDGNNYLPIYAYESEQHEGFQTLWYNLDTRKIEWKDTKDAYPKGPYFDFKLDSQQFQDKLGKDTFPITYPLASDVDTSWIQQSRLAKDNPKAAALLNTADSQIFMIDKSVQDYMEFYSQLVPPETDLYEGVLPASMTKDGLEYPFHSKAEFEQFYDKDKNNELTKQEQTKSILRED